MISLRNVPMKRRKSLFCSYCSHEAFLHGNIFNSLCLNDIPLPVPIVPIKFLTPR